MESVINKLKIFRDKLKRFGDDLERVANALEIYVYEFDMFGR